MKLQNDLTAATVGDPNSRECLKARDLGVVDPLWKGYPERRNKNAR